MWIFSSSICSTTANKYTVNKNLKPKYTYHKKKFRKNLSCIDQLLNTYGTSHWLVKDIKENLFLKSSFAFVKWTNRYHCKF